MGAEPSQTATWGEWEFDVYSLLPMEGCTSEDSKRLPSAPGLFVFAYWDLSRQGWRPWYIGETENLAESLPTHEKLQAALQRGVNCVHVKLVADITHRVAMTRHLTANYRPPENYDAE